MPTARATDRLMERIEVSGGSSPPALSLRVGESSANANADALIIASETRRARDERIPRAKPGKIYELLVCAKMTGLPLKVVGGNGLPVPIKARPSVHSAICWGVASQRETGLDNGKMTGRSTCLAIVRIASSVKVPGWPETPMRTVGFVFLITSTKLTFLGSVLSHPAMSEGFRANASCSGRTPWPPFTTNP